MDKDRVEGKVKDIAGRAQRQVGEWTGDTEVQAKAQPNRPKARFKMPGARPKTRLENLASRMWITRRISRKNRKTSSEKLVSCSP